MMLKPNVLKVSMAILVAVFLGSSSCKDEVPERITVQDTADLTDEAVTESYFQDLDDMAGVVIEAPSDAEYSAGRTSGSIAIEDHRFKCEGVSISIVPDAASTPAFPKGVLTVDFGSAGCTDSRGNVRKGKLIFAYNGKRFMPGATVVTTTENYFINDVKLEGVRTLTNLQNSTSDAPRFNAVLANGKATFPNASFATRDSEITFEWDRAANPLGDKLRVEDTSHASGITRGGRSYEVDVVETLVYARHCGIPVSGVKKWTVDEEKEVTIDYGDGDCDRAFTITVNGITRQIDL